MGMLREREREGGKEREILLSREFDQWFNKCSLLGVLVIYEFASVHPCPQLPVS